MRTLLRTEPTITKRSRVIKGATVEDYRIYCGKDATGKRVQFFRSTQAEAKQVAAEWGQKAKTLGDAALALTPAQTVDAANAYALLKGTKYQSSLMPIVEAWVKAYGNTNYVTAPSLVLVYELYSGTFAPEQNRHIESVRSIVGRFVMKSASLGAKPSDVTRADVERWLSCTSCASSYNAHLSYLGAFFSWANKTYHTGNPCEGFARKSVAYEEPSFMQALNVESLFLAAQASPDASLIIPRMTLGFFCGMRSAEIDRLASKDISADNYEVRVSMPKGYTHGVKPRMVKISPNAAAWLAKYPFTDDHTSCYRRDREILKRLAYELGDLTLDRNTMRHTYATMHVAYFRDMEMTACEMGHSGGTRLLLSHYRGLVSKAEAAKFWSIEPTHKLETT